MSQWSRPPPRYPPVGEQSENAHASSRRPRRVGANGTVALTATVNRVCGVCGPCQTVCCRSVSAALTRTAVCCVSGLCFSVQRGVTPPPSLVNMYKELEADVDGFRRPGHGCLVGWARQGVLLLNACLTVRSGQPNSHKDQVRGYGITAGCC